MTRHVSRTRLDADSALNAHIQPGDFVDCFSVASDLPPRTAGEIATVFPGWVQRLMSLRNLLVRPFGLDTDPPINGDRLGIFPVTHETETEIIAGFNDKHLDFRLSVRSYAGTVSMATWVHRHNLGGRFYLALILPFHILIVRNALARVAKQSG